jgi:DNA-binding transcriptional LysR family regulator
MAISMMQQFDVFAQVVARGSIAQSAQDLGIAPAKVLETMTLLEDRMGYQLFTVEDGTVSLTAAGRKMVAALSRLTLEDQEQWVGQLSGDGRAATEDESARSEEQTTLSPPTSPPPEPEPEEEITPRHFRPQYPPVRGAKIARADPEPEQSIVLASHPAIFSHFQEALIAFEQASPDIGIALNLAPLDAAALAALFEAGEADIGYYYASGNESDALESRYAWSERISLFTGKQGTLARSDVAVADDLREAAYVALAPGNLSRGIAESVLARNGLAVPKPALETDDLYKIMKFLETEEAYFAAFGTLARDFGKMSAISRLAYGQGLPQVEVRQAISPKLRHDPAVLALAEFLFR